MTNMTALAWATYGLILATVAILASALFTAIGRSDALRIELGARIDSVGRELRSELGGRIDDLASDIRSLRQDTNSRFDSLRQESNSRFDSLHQDFRDLRASVGP